MNVELGWLGTIQARAASGIREDVVLDDVPRDDGELPVVQRVKRDNRNLEEY